MRFVPRVAVLRRVVRASAGAAASALGAASAAHGPLEAGARLLGNARAHGRLPLARARRFGSLMEFFVALSMSLGVFSLVYFTVRFFVSFSMKLGVLFRVFG